MSSCRCARRAIAPLPRRSASCPRSGLRRDRYGSARPRLHGAVAAFGWGVRASVLETVRCASWEFVGRHGVIGLAWPPMHRLGTGWRDPDRYHAHRLFDGDRSPHAAGDRIRGSGIRKAVPPLLPRDPGGPGRVWRPDGVDAPRIAANLPTPWIGVWERINIGVFLLWVVVLAIALLRIRETSNSTGTRHEESSAAGSHERRPMSPSTGLREPASRRCARPLPTTSPAGTSWGRPAASTSTARRWSTCGEGFGTRPPARRGKRTPWSWCSRQPRAWRPWPGGGPLRVAGSITTRGCARTGRSSPRRARTR